MSLWKIRIAVPDDPASQGALTSALAGQPVSGVRVMPGRASAPATTSEIVVELPQDENLATMLSALHEISPQVFVSRADVPGAERSPAPEPSATEPVL